MQGAHRSVRRWQPLWPLGLDPGLPSACFCTISTRGMNLPRPRALTPHHAPTPPLCFESRASRTTSCAEGLASAVRGHRGPQKWEGLGPWDRGSAADEPAWGLCTLGAHSGGAVWGPHTLGADSGGEQQGPIWRALLRLASSQLALDGQGFARSQ